jgi:hypothetical protein
MELIEELDYEFDFDQLKKDFLNFDYHDITRRFEGISLQHRNDILPPWNDVDGLESIGLYNCVEKDFNVINKNFKNTEFEKIINNFNLIRSRILIMNKKSCYSIHHDYSWRLHMPIKTNSKCLFYFPDHEKHFNLEEGKVYKVNTTQKHTFLNSSFEERIHFIGCIDVL